MPLGLISLHCDTCGQETIHKIYRCVHCGTRKQKDWCPPPKEYTDDLKRYGKHVAIKRLGIKRRRALRPLREQQRRERVEIPDADVPCCKGLKFGRERTRC